MLVNTPVCMSKEQNLSQWKSEDWKTRVWEKGTFQVQNQVISRMALSCRQVISCNHGSRELADWSTTIHALNTKTFSPWREEVNQRRAVRRRNGKRKEKEMPWNMDCDFIANKTLLFILLILISIEFHNLEYCYIFLIWSLKYLRR